MKYLILIAFSLFSLIPLHDELPAHPRLYQGTASIESAMSFAGVPDELLESRRAGVRGDLIDAELRSFVSRLLTVRDKRDEELLRDLMHPESLIILEEEHPEILDLLRNGDLFYADSNPNLYATKQNGLQENLERFFSSHETKPDAVIILYHYDQPKRMLIGAQIFIVNNQDGIFMQLPSIPRNAQQIDYGTAEMPPGDERTQ